MKGIIVINAFRRPKACVGQAERLKNEFAKLGVETEIVSDAAERFLIKNGRTESKISGVDFAVFLDKDEYVAAELENAGIRLFNKRESVFICDDKAKTYIKLASNGLNMPDTIIAPLCYSTDDPLDRKFLDNAANFLGFPMIVKENKGSMGFGVYLVNNYEELLTVSEKLKTVPHLYQKYLGAKKGTDVRIIVIGKKFVGATERINENDFRSNVAQGGYVKAVNPPKSFIAAAEKAARILKLDYCGVDILYGENGEPFICEVNSNAFFDGFNKATGIDVPAVYAGYIYKKLKNHI